jgi:hypothetical protein
MIRKLSVLLACLTVVVGIGAAGVASAAKPTVTEIDNPLHSEGVDPFVSAVCGFDVEILNEGRVRITEFSDGTRQLSIHETYYWTANGNSLAEYDNHTVVFGVDDSISVHGTVFNIQVPGFGVALKEAGTVVFDRDGNIVRMSGLHQFLDGTGNDNLPALCNYLAP